MAERRGRNPVFFKLLYGRSDIDNEK